MRKSTGLYPSLRVAGSGQRVVSMGGSVLLVTTATMATGPLELSPGPNFIHTGPGIGRAVDIRS